MFLGLPRAVANRFEGMFRVAEYLVEEVSGLNHDDNRLHCDPGVPGGLRLAVTGADPLRNHLTDKKNQSPFVKMSNNGW